MRRHLFVIAALVLITSIVHGQEIFATKTATGQVLHFMPSADGHTATVVHPQKEWPYYTSDKPSGSIRIPNHISHRGKEYVVVGIAANAFYRCDSITHVELGDSCLSIGTQAFNGCTALRHVALGARLQTIGEGAFAYCHSLQTISLPSTVSHVGLSAFAMCGGLVGIRMDEKLLPRLGSLTFYGTPLANEGKKVKKESSGRVFVSHMPSNK